MQEGVSYMEVKHTGIVSIPTHTSKKTQKTPKSEIDKAVKLKNEYYENK